MTKLPALVAVTAITALQANAQLVTSTVTMAAAGQIVTNSSPRISASANQPVYDADSLAASGGTASATTGTEGISLITLPQHPGETFVYTAPFAATSSANAGSWINGQSETLSGTSVLRRDCRWRIDSLSPGRDGTQGTIVLTFRYSLNLVAHEINGALFSLRVNNGNNGTLDRIAAATSGTIYPNGTALFVPELVTVSENNGLWSAIAVPFTFGAPFDLSWTLTSGSGAGHPTGYTTSSTSAQLWKVEVRDANGQLLTRYSDYEWFELLKSDGSIVGHAATAETIGPHISIDRAASGAIEMTYNGILQQSDDLLGWQDVVPAHPSRFEILPTSMPRKFYRVRMP